MTAHTGHTCLGLGLLLALSLFWTASAGAATERPIWWEHLAAEARQGGYGLIDEAELKALLDSGRDMVLLDVRPDYEFARGHLPGALNLEFHLGHRLELSSQQAQALEALLGPDRSRTVVIYCRSYR